MHDAGRILLGTVQSSYKVGVTNYLVADPSAFPAGTIVRQDASGTLTTEKSAGRMIGVSLGIDLSDTDRVVVLKAGLRCPVLLANLATEGEAYPQVILGSSVWVDDETGLATEEGEASSESRAIYATEQIIGVAEDGTEVAVALVDLIGGL